MEGIFFVLLVFAVVGAIFWGVLQQYKATSAAWAEAARDLGISHDPGGTFRRARLEGTMGGFPVRIETYTERTGNNSSSVFTRYRVGFPDLGLGLRLSRQTAMSKIGRFFGMQDVETGDEAFDDAFVVKADQPEMLQAHLTASRRSALHRLLASYGSATVSDDKVQVVSRGYERRPEVIVSTTRRLVSIARTLTEHQPRPALDEAVEARAAGDLGRAAEQLRVTVRPHPDDLEMQLQEAETFHAAGDDAAAAAVIEDLASRLPADPDVDGLKRQITRRAAPVPTRQPSIPVNDTAQELFGPNRLSFETDAVFNEKYRGAFVRWTGKVKRVVPYETDYDFAGGPGTKAVITVASISNDLYGQTEIDAVVQLPAGAAQRLERDGEATFEGTLERIDPLMRNLYVTGGRLV